MTDLIIKVHLLPTASTFTSSEKEFGSVLGRNGGLGGGGFEVNGKKFEDILLHGHEWAIMVPFLVFLLLYLVEGMGGSQIAERGKIERAELTDAATRCDTDRAGKVRLANLE